jgi:Icc-related predicted phosphoesterase
MTPCFFVTDLHGETTRYEKLWRKIERSAPRAVFLGGDLLPSGLAAGIAAEGGHGDFVRGFLAAGFAGVRARLGADYPDVFVIPGNDDGKLDEAAMSELEAAGLWLQVHGRGCPFGDYRVYGYAYVPPTPFLLKDWERYDVSRYVPPGCVSPEEGLHSTEGAASRTRFATIQRDLETLVPDGPLDDTVVLFHTPPFETVLDRVANDGKQIDHVPLDLHVGSIAVRRFIEQRQPLLTLHGHVHESVRLTGAWRQCIGRTRIFGAAHDGPELALVRFDPAAPDDATRELL